MPEPRQVRLLTAKDMGLILDRMAYEILERSGGSNRLALIGIRTRGDILAQRLQERIGRAAGREVPLGVLDITLYRDDLDALGSKLHVGRTRIDFELRERQVVLVDDVLYTGRTVRAALDEVLDLGRPS
ncbi:MAG: bifunctional pyr operon transcriptional regulator/uracil phosphoribosyltransferase PyrR, partial [Deltaproteobacteria bacterium]|nr:bifunctional pyr operon transcriptional regulator/uracil phosphoribosyltransferase PyrR [Deltaproteobacteria bacterium]